MMGSGFIMWDMTNISAVRFEDAALQRAKWSEYYSENCWKGGVGMMLHGYLIAEDLWGGGTSDSLYHAVAGYLEEQQRFQEKDRVFDAVNNIYKIVTFLNILDQGFRAKMVTRKHGKQQTLQPPSCKSDERFTGRKTMYAAGIAHDRSGNERGVNVCKRLALMKRRFHQRMNPIRFNCIWKYWAFRANFMYKPVL